MRGLPHPIGLHASCSIQVSQGQHTPPCMLALSSRLLNPPPSWKKTHTRILRLEILPTTPLFTNLNHKVQAMDQASIPQSGFNIQQYIANSLSDENLEAGGEFLVQGAKNMRHVAGTAVEWYQGLEPGQFTSWYQDLYPEVLMQWINILLEWLKTPR